MSKEKSMNKSIIIITIFVLIISIVISLMIIGIYYYNNKIEVRDEWNGSTFIGEHNTNIGLISGSGIGESNDYKQNNEYDKFADQKKPVVEDE